MTSFFFKANDNISSGKRENKNFDYKKLDDERSIKFKEEKLYAAKLLGYEYITEAVHKLYNERGPSVAAEKMDMTTTGIYHILGYIGVEVNKRKRGGRNNTKLTEEKVKAGRAIWNGRVDGEYIRALMVVLEVDASENCLRSALRGIDTWRDID